MLSVLFVPITSASGQTDVDGDGIVDGLDDCPNAWGNSTIDRQGCPDHDGDGTSDLNDPLVMANGGYLEDARITSSDNMVAVLFMPGNGTYYLRVMNGNTGGWGGQDTTTVRVVETSTKNTVRTVSLSGVHTVDIAWSPDGERFAIHTEDEEIRVYNTYSGLLDFTADTDGEDAGEIEFSPDGSMIVAVGYQDGNNGNGQVQIFNATTGDEIADFSPGSSDYFYSVDFSPDGEFLLIGGNDNFYIYYANNQTLFRTVTPNFSYMNAVAWSPDGNMVSICEGWGGSNARARVYHALNGTQIFSYTTSTSCLDTAWSPDSSQIAFSHSYYRADGASIHIFDARTGTKLDTLSAPRPGSCNSSGGGNNCGQINGIDWHPDGNYIISAHGRNDEGIYHWIVDPDIDGDGVLNPDDAFPEDGTQWDDSDGDGYGDNPSGNEPDGCINTPGTSTQDQFGCVDTDSDGWSDSGDDYPTDFYQWVDADGDSYPDNTADPRSPPAYGAVDYLPQNPTQWNDSDGDGWGDNYADQSWNEFRDATWPGIIVPGATEIDQFPLNNNQWLDTDGDWWGDNQVGDDADACPSIYGNSTADRYGCPDTDGDSYSDPTANWGPVSSTGYCQADGVPLDPTQWCDRDGDGYGNNQDGNNPDECPDQSGSSMIDRIGCPDTDGDGYSDQGDPFPDDETQWSNRDGDSQDCGGDNQSGNSPDVFPDDPTQCKDTDGDGYGDNAAGNNGDAFKFDPTQWSDFDGDGYGDNNGTGSINGDICPTLAGNSANPISRGCPDSDGDGFVDPEDAFPQNPLQWSDRDGDGYGDEVNRPGGDDCPDTFGTSQENNRFGCLDTDNDGWADVDDEFPEDNEQWKDTDGDGYGDNYLWTVTYIQDQEDEERIIQLREQRGDAFPTLPDEWSDQDGDGYGDNNSDDFPLEVTQWSDFDGDGYGDNFTAGAYQPDDCTEIVGTSYRDVYGCLDYDNDGTSDTSDPCPYDPDIFEGRIGSVVCEVTEPQQDGDSNSESAGSSTETSLIFIGIAILVLLSIIVVAQFSKTLAKKKSRKERADEAMVNSAFSEEDERRTAWIDYYVANGQLDEARALGWVDNNPNELPQWKQFEIQQQEAQDAAIPNMVNLDDIL